MKGNKTTNIAEATIGSKNKSNELKRIINGNPVILRFSDTEDKNATDTVQDIMLNSFGKKAFKDGLTVPNM